MIETGYLSMEKYIKLQLLELNHSLILTCIYGFEFNTSL